MDVILKNIYKPTDEYFLLYGLPSSIIIILVMTITSLFMKAQLGESKTNWTINKCVPKYMFVSGFIKKNPDSNELSSTYDNFKDCVNQYKETKSTGSPQEKVYFDSANFFGKKSFT